ncbi:MAG: glycoside hydrolase family 43 protein [Micromonosporaceae bacterium]
MAVAVAGIAAGTTLLAAPAANAASVGDVAIDKNFADPSILKSGKTYYAYATGGNAKGAFPYATAPSMAGPWTKHGRSMPDKPAWVGPNSDGDYTFWAPSVFRNEQGTYVMYFTANKKGSSDRCIGAAVSNAAKGPFKALRNPLVCRKGSEVIDPTEVKRGGQRYVLYKVNDHRGHFQIRIQKVDQRGLHTTGDPKVLIEKSRQIEAPDATYHNGKVYFFVSRFSYTNCSYRTDVYRARSLTSGDWHFVKTLMSTRNTGRCGPGGAEVRTMDGKLWMVFHAWKCAKNARCDAGSKSEKARYRAMLTSRLGWGPNGPKLIKDKPSQPKPSSTRPEPSSTATGTAAPTASDAAPGGGGGGGENAPAPKAGEKELPVTGMAVGGLLALGLGAFVVGLVIRATTRRRRTGTS